MTVMNDFFKRGYQFDGATGEKTGANLEDLATRLVPTAGSQLVDDSSLQVYADAGGIVDDAGVAVNRLRVKAGGITAAMMATGALWGASVAVTKAMFGFSGFSAGSPLSDGDLDLILTASNTTATGALTVAASAAACIYSTLPSDAVYRGWFIAKVRTTGIVSTVLPFAAMDNPITVTSGHPEFDVVGPTFISTISGTDKDAWLMTPFWGKTVGIVVSQGTGGVLSMKLLRWAVLGEAVSNF